MTVSSLRGPAAPALPLLLVWVALAGCSTAKLAYNNSDWLLLRKLDVYLDLSAEQSAAASERLHRHLEAHRRQELPAYLQYLQRTRSMVADGLSREEADWIVRRGRELIKKTVARTTPEIAATLSGITEAQIRHLEAHFEKLNREFRDDYILPPEQERNAKKIRRATRRIEHWTGRLSGDQRERVAELRSTFPDNTGAWLDYTMDRQRQLLALLRAGAGENALADFLLSWWVRAEGRNLSLQRGGGQALDAFIRLIIGVDETLTSSQRRYLLWRLDNYIVQIEELIVQG